MELLLELPPPLLLFIKKERAADRKKTNEQYSICYDVIPSRAEPERQ